MYMLVALAQDQHLLFLHSHFKYLKSMLIRSRSMFLLPVWLKLAATRVFFFFPLDVARGGEEGRHNLKELILNPFWPFWSSWSQRSCFHRNTTLRIKTSESLCNQLLCVCRGSAIMRLMGARGSSGVCHTARTNKAASDCVRADVFVAAAVIIVLVSWSWQELLKCLCKESSVETNTNQVKVQYNRCAHVL